MGDLGRHRSVEGVPRPGPLSPGRHRLEGPGELASTATDRSENQMSNVHTVTVRTPPPFDEASSKRGMALWLKRVPLLMLVTTALTVSCLWIGSGEAAALPVLWQKCEEGPGGGQCGERVAGVAASSSSGSVFVVDEENSRINEFSPWGVFLRSWGWGVVDGLPKLESCGPSAVPSTPTCQTGINGIGSGQFANPRGISVDSQNNVYVHESPRCISGSGCIAAQQTNRVQKFAPDGSFVLMFGKEVNLTRVAEREAQESAAEPVTVTPEQENICTAASGDTCGRGKAGSGPGEFGTGPLLPIDPVNARLIATAPNDKIEVGGQERIQVFDSEGHYEKSIPLPDETITSLTVDSLGNSYVAVAAPGFFTGVDDDVVKLDPLGEEVCRNLVAAPQAVAIDGQDRLYVASQEDSTLPATIHRFSPACVEDSSFQFSVSGMKFPDGVSGIASSSACGMDGNLYFANLSSERTFLRAYYPAPNATLCPAPSVPPRIADQYAVAVGSSTAVVRAKVNPRFWPDATYYVEYGTEECNSVPGACTKTTLFPGVQLQGGSADEALNTSGVFLAGLQPDTTYYYRFVAQSGGGGPVHGIGEEEASGTFTTFPAASPLKTDCANQAFRSGPSAPLPDCRAYEMVSPVDKEGGELVVGVTDLGDRAWLNLAAGNGERATYSSYRAFGNSPSSPYSVQYLAERGETGWSNEGISVPQEGPSYLEGGQDLDAYYKAFDDELCNAWLRQPTNPLLAPEAISGYANLYRRQGCGSTSFEALTRTPPIYDPEKGEQPLSPRSFSPEVVGFSADGTHTIFAVQGKLTENAPPCSPGTAECKRQLYHYHAGDLELVCIFPNGEPSKDSCWAGSGGRITVNGKNNLVQNAISADGSRIFWTNRIAGSSNVEIGKLYVRIDDVESRLISANPTRFWAASRDGSRVIYSVFSGGSSIGNLFEESVDSGEKTLVAREVTSVAGVSQDARRIYFASKEALPDAGANSEGDTPQAGQRNLYFHEEGEAGGDGVLAFIGTLAAEDETEQFGSINFSPFYKTSRVTPDGLHAAFTSLVPLTGGDNLDVDRGRPVTEVFLYDAASRILRCVSCNPTNARPRGRAVIVNNSPQALLFGGTIPGWPNQIQPSRALSDDGKRLFFESYEQLVPTDTNGKRDVYEWEAGDAAGECKEAGAQLFLVAEGGCISLISSGESPADSSFIDAGRTGQDVFFATASSLVPQDPGLIDLYDAREGGGFPIPTPPPPACEGETCQGAYTPPQDPTPASANFQGPGNVVEKPKKKKHKPKRSKSKKKHKANQKSKQGKKQRQNDTAVRAEGGHR